MKEWLRGSGWISVGIVGIDPVPDFINTMDKRVLALRVAVRRFAAANA